MKKASHPAKKPAKKTAGKSSKKVENFQPTYVALAISSVAVVALVGFAIIGWVLTQ